MIGQYLFLNCAVIFAQPPRMADACQGGTCLHTFQQQKPASLTSSLHISANITGKRITFIFCADFILFKVGIVGVFQEKVGKSRKLSKKYEK